MSDTTDRRASLVDVAQAAGVSASTASRVLSRRGDYSPATRRAVLDAAARLGYDRDTTARGRRAQTDQRLVELVLGGLGGPWSHQVIVGAHERAFALGYDLVLTKERDDPLDDWPGRIAARRSSGVVFAIITPTRRQLDLIADFAVPSVVLDPRADTEPGVVTVGATNRQGGRDAAHHLVAQGYERFVFATSALRYRFGRAREQGFREELARLAPGAEVEVIDADWIGGVSRAGIDRLVALSADARLGVFAVNDAVAHTVVSAVLRSGRRVPDDIGVMGFDDDPRPPGGMPLTTVRQPIHEMAALAVDLVDRLGRGEPLADRQVELPTELVVRRSTSAA
ncbi:LacI family transcriptional regulator [Microbacterium sp. 4R-513]|uniref:LacI family DNA-binding transcriptional regulator n=1 Tax=Microbacterium sp. 4R-513 TaxID=2567934 RepID=UPI0013E1EECC|nr:LacI family DNA-binding transcriptional regulator [Microbacterium sp. 4R-513]QIG39557.1 LacI family transcriptional regulator [Microbacterium sp. 4R-513]